MTDVPQPGSETQFERTHERQTIAIELEHGLVVRFRHEAARRDVPVTRLIHELLDVIAADELVGAVLDDGP